MKKLIASLTLLVSFFSLVGAQDSLVKFDENRLLEHQKILSSDVFKGRKTGEKGNDSARAYIISQFKTLNIPQFGESYEHVFTVKYKGVSASKGVNILAEIKGAELSDKYIVISAHYDHLGEKNGQIYNGADDNASGVAALFAFAEYLKVNPPKHSVIFAAFDAEEIGLQGAKYFVNHTEKEKILLNINMDMISRSSKNELYVVGGRYNNKLQSILQDFKNPTDTRLLQGHDGMDGKQDWTYSSDHSPFHSAGIPFLYFGNEDHSAYHRPNDDFDDITPEFYKNSVYIILSLLEIIDNSRL